MSKNRKRQRRPRLVPELPPGAPLPPHAEYILPYGKTTRDQGILLALRRAEALDTSLLKSILSRPL